jgi:ketosteroid isomerase-like protein
MPSWTWARAVEPVAGQAWCGPNVSAGRRFGLAVARCRPAPTRRARRVIAWKARDGDESGPGTRTGRTPGARFATGERFRPIRIRSVHADGDTVIVVWDGRGVANDGRPYENSYAWIMRLADGKVVDGTAFYDSISFNDLWTRVQP